MNALKDIRELVRATEFIGQSSGTFLLHCFRIVTVC